MKPKFLVVVFLSFLMLGLFPGNARASKIKSNNQVIFDGNRATTVRFYVDEIAPGFSRKQLKKGLRVELVLDDAAAELVNVKPKRFIVPVKRKKGKFRLSKAVRFKLKNNVEITEPLNLSYEIKALSSKQISRFAVENLTDSVFIAAEDTGLQITGNVKAVNNKRLSSVSGATVSIYDSSDPDNILVSESSDADGNYSIVLPQEQSLSSSLIASVTVDGQTFRAPVVTGSLSIDPISETITKEILEEGDSISVNEANALIDQIANQNLEDIYFDSDENSTARVDASVQAALNTITDVIGVDENTSSVAEDADSDSLNNSDFINQYSDFFIFPYDYYSYEIGLNAATDGSRPGLNANIISGLAAMNPFAYAWLNLATISEDYSSAELNKAGSEYQLEIQENPSEAEDPRMLAPFNTASFSPFTEVIMPEIEPSDGNGSDLFVSNDTQRKYYGYNDVFFVASAQNQSFIIDANGNQNFINQNFGFDILSQKIPGSGLIFNNTQYNTLSFELDIENGGTAQYSSALEVMDVTPSSGQGSFTSAGTRKFISRSVSPTVSAISSQDTVTREGSIFSVAKEIFIDFNDSNTEDAFGSVNSDGDIIVYFYGDDQSLNSHRRIVFGVPSHTSTVDLTQNTYKLFKLYVSASGNNIQIGSDFDDSFLTIDANGTALATNSVTDLATRSETSQLSLSSQTNTGSIYTIISEANGLISGNFEGLTLDGYASQDGKILLLRAAEGSQNASSTEMYFIFAIAI